MITFEVFIVIVASAGVAYLAANAYVQHSLRSFSSADAMLTRINENLEKLVESDVPVGVARMGFMFAATAGCGCFVRGIVLSHYMPSSLARLIAGGPRRDSPIEKDLLDLDKLDGGQRAIFSELVASVIVYDAFRKPLWGLVFGPAIRRYEPASFTERADAELTAVSILSRKKPEKLPVAVNELCAVA